MSEYYDVFFAFDLRPDTPQTIVDALQYLRGENPDFIIPSGSKFLEAEWEALLHVEKAGMVVFPGVAISELQTAYRGNNPPNQGGEAIYNTTICYRNEILDDGLDIYMWFFDWIQPYVDTQGLIGYVRNEYANDYWRITSFDGKIDVNITPNPQQ